MFRVSGFEGLLVWKVRKKTLALRRDLSMSKDMRDLSWANVGFAANMFIQYSFFNYGIWGYPINNYI
jgi:hypothetical protein